ncbi:hypothetical protein [Nonomuraea cavernae]|uniref:Uncharacterized protein n=1 Tax=Nonomuraea cavernae TaxID=2045107 RepID=A0A918DGR7_9ACTN|nr:hypothetical protein [Nonomuraea cavernae]MCA2185313.1 hypothetical protein [Nonomuraea cavernae]GGO66078.1 hypothetical protein GCM10012289_19230 [Nonomuraea cavernae]
MQDPTEPDRQEILTGPGDAPGSPRKRKPLVLAASALVAVLAAGGVGYALAGNTPAQVGQSVQPPSTGDAPEEVPDADDGATGDATTDVPQDGTASDADTDTGADTGTRPDTGSRPDAGPADEPADRGSAGTDAKRSTNVGTGKKPTSPPSAPVEDDPADNPADGPAGLVSGECAKSGC